MNHLISVYELGRPSRHIINIRWVSILISSIAWLKISSNYDISLLMLIIIIYHIFSTYYIDFECLI